MVTMTTGNLLRAEVEALVNTVNTVGVMGKGVAYQFKQAFPENARAYEKACKLEEVRIGSMFVTHTGRFEPRLIINFPTKRHWKGNSRIDDIRAGLTDLVRVIREERIRSIAIPPLGCGLGGLRWEDVRPLIVTAFEELPEVEVQLFPPGNVAGEDRVVNTPKPEMSAWRAALIKIVDAYGALGSEATHLEAQKLLYLLVAAGEPVRAKFTKGDYGPYDQGMKHGLQGMDGHYVVGFGDGDRLEPVRLKTGAIDQADEFLRQQPTGADVERRIERIVCLINGFETPYGLELLATVHWVVAQEDASSFEESLERIRAWNGRKRKVMRPEHVQVAWERLEQEGWLAAH